MGESICLKCLKVPNHSETKQLNPKLLTTIHINMSQLTTTMNNFLLLNDEGDALADYYMKFTSVPNQAGDIGVAKYVDKNTNTEDMIEFTFSAKKQGYLIAWHQQSPKIKFMIRQIIDEDEIVGLEVKFDEKNIAYFALELDNYDLDSDMTPMNAAHVTSLTSCVF